MSDKRKLADGYEHHRFCMMPFGGLDVILGHGNIYALTDAEEDHPECFAAEPKESKPRELRTGYKRVQESGPNGRTIIFWDSSSRLGTAVVGPRHCWIEGTDKIPDHVYAPEPQAVPTGSQEFREGDWVEGRRVGNMPPEYLRVIPPLAELPKLVRTRDCYGNIHLLEPSRLTLLHRPSTPTGPPVVGSCVAGPWGPVLRVIQSIGTPDSVTGLIAFWFTDDDDPQVHLLSDLIHIASPRTPEDH